MDSFIDWRKNFIGKTAALAERQRGAAKRLVTMIVETTDIDVCNDEAILKNGECIGYVTSGGYAHYVKQSVALGYLPLDLAIAGTAVEIEINGEQYAATVLGKPLYDPDGKRIRS